eukprot:GHVN01058684.1.p2 GENE.GHVN01058684.1~~GHVN01058684.1.p2  ORF type:complete len:118 (-),score=12.21 GHVN01058684.1:2076-2429(-)
MVEQQDVATFRVYLIHYDMMPHTSTADTKDDQATPCKEQAVLPLSPDRPEHTPSPNDEWNAFTHAFSPVVESVEIAPPTKKKKRTLPADDQICCQKAHTVPAMAPFRWEGLSKYRLF